MKYCFYIYSSLIILVTFSNCFSLRDIPTRKLYKLRNSDYKTLPCSRRMLSLNLSLDPTAFSLFKEALAVNGILFGALNYSQQKSLSPAGLIHSFILGVGLWTFVGIKVCHRRDNIMML